MKIKFKNGGGLLETNNQLERIINQKRNKKRMFLIFGILLLGMGKVQAITTNEVTYNNNGVEENLTEALDTLYTELKQYKTGGNVTPSEMLEGSSGYSKGVLVTGSIKKKEAITYTPGVNNITITKGQYLNGNQVILGDSNLKSENIKSGVSLFGVNGTYTSDANAFSGAILSGYSAYVNGSKIDGTMANNFTNTGITLTTADTRPVNVVRRESGDSRIWYLQNSDGVQRLNIGVPNNGYYDTRNTLAIENADIAQALGITGDKIVKGNTIAGVSGTADLYPISRTVEKTSVVRDGGAWLMTYGKMAILNFYLEIIEDIPSWTSKEILILTDNPSAHYKGTCLRQNSGLSDVIEASPNSNTIKLAIKANSMSKGEWIWGQFIFTIN